jgi:8-oxo-dGTP pyrophosphatase MutT (NUDIX family)
MSLLDRIRICHRRDMAKYRPFLANGAAVGWINRDLADRLRGFPRVFRIGENGVELIPRGYDPRTAAIADVVAALRDEGLVKGWRDEAFPVATSFNAPPLFAIERAAVKAFGIRYYCVQLNGLVGAAERQAMWIGRRAMSKPIGPGKLDQIVGGGVPLGYSLAEALVKECAEEAGMPAALAGHARPVGAITILAEEDGGLWHETLFNYDLTLPDDFTPENTDGEVESFELMSVAEVRNRLESSDDFLFDVVPLLADCLMRHGHLSADDPDYVALAELLAAEPNLAGPGL